MRTVLHITEAFGGGIQTAINSYVESTKNSPIQHLLLARRRPQDDIGLKMNPQFQHIEMVEGNLIRFYLKAKEMIQIHQPDVLHLHSSFAGFLGRFLPKGMSKIIYTPHCYAFERGDISAFKQKIYHGLERVRLSHIDVVAGCSFRECALAKKMGAKESYYLNNFANISASKYIKNIHDKKKNIQTKKLFNVMVMGRVCPQKDPHFLLQTLEHLALYPNSKQVKLHWIGGGDKNWTRALEYCDVHVTGIVHHNDIIKALQSADLYLHTAAWEGMPLTLLEAAKLNVPMIVRRIGATQDLPFPFLVDSPEEMAKEIIAFIQNPTHPSYLSALTFFNQEFSLEKQTKALLDLYGFNLTDLDAQKKESEEKEHLTKEGAA